MHLSGQAPQLLPPKEPAVRPRRTAAEVSGCVQGFWIYKASPPLCLLPVDEVLHTCGPGAGRTTSLLGLMLKAGRYCSGVEDHLFRWSLVVTQPQSPLSLGAAALAPLLQLVWAKTCPAHRRGRPPFTSNAGACSAPRPRGSLRTHS